MPTLKLSSAQKAFLLRANLMPSQVYDGRGIGYGVLKIQMKAGGAKVAVRGKPCRHGHTLDLWDRQGHCQQCFPQTLAVAARHTVTGQSVYVAYSKSLRLAKVGISTDPSTRVHYLVRKAFCGASDWHLAYELPAPNAAAIETATHQRLTDNADRVEYRHGGRLVVSREVFRVSVGKAITAVTAATVHLDEVGKPITSLPPHRSVRAELPHTAPALKAKLHSLPAGSCLMHWITD
jgi:hypothetical protein